ncbi:MAG TPA: hypothetical protein VK553_02690 [Candidatus Nitrosopolaris rasttigaisensis]|nr:hypothetical protein [Thermoproteota archaeon]HMH09589.1 hypothetical protein [Candidatus Nitrosopolaris rasttigaisensis]
MERIQSSRLVLVDIKPAIDVIPGMKKNSIFHAGPPIESKRMTGPLRGDIVATMIFEGLAG